MERWRDGRLARPSVEAAKRGCPALHQQARDHAALFSKKDRDSLSVRPLTTND
jgi:hypothetical protein